MTSFLIDMPTLTTFWVEAPSQEEAIKALKDTTHNLELRLQIGDKKTPIELVNFTRSGEPEIVEGDEDENEDNHGDEGAKDK
jgi:hypothetical protein